MCIRDRYSVETRIQGKGKTMKHKIVLLLAAFLCAGALSPTTTQAAVGFSVQVGDYPYYTHGSYYWRNGVRWHWVPGHWSYRHHHRYWVHGYYAPRHRYYAPYRYCLLYTSDAADERSSVDLGGRRIIKKKKK